MATYQLEFWQNNGVLNRENRHWHSDSSAFQIELHLHRLNNGVLRVTNRTFYVENRGRMREVLIRILLEEQIPVNSDGVEFILHSPSGLPFPIPVYSLEHLEFFILQTVRLMSNDPTNGELQQLDDSIILDDESFEEVGLSNTSIPLLKEGKLEASTDCSICLESVDVGEVVAPLPCSHLYHKICITHWLHKKPSCPLCRAPAI
ncbi:hypothetical protein JRO89_XS15G0011600 [Xanthoceras sorbifolium]|uniref:RING-type domain-containing protein n=1 Tax=Xanthoceras sorbifolium TaxID=99658 RepID=A0ABQ8H0N9_9ROSI|nr:hypothetical protein JRO89_XS15G0011600 [Xanthoceras sorbifolium]